MEGYIITFKSIVNVELLKRHGAKNIETFKHIKKVVSCKLDESEAKHLSEHKNISKVELDIDNDIDDIHKFGSSESDQQQESYALDLMQVDEFHKRGIKGQGVKVAVLDSGCQYHEDLNLAGRYAAHPDGSSFPLDHGSHGTSVTGVIGMQDNDIGYLGVAPECELYAIRRHNDDNESSITAQIRAMDWCIDNDIDVVNCSFSSTVDNVGRREAFRIAAEEHGIIIVTSAGNRQSDVDLNQSTMGYPSSYPFVYAVANILEDKSKANASSVGPRVEFSAGGQNIMSTDIDPNNEISSIYSSNNGTSFSSPAVAGMVALYKQMFPDLSRVGLIRKMQENCERIGDKWIYGAGIPQFPKEMKDIRMNNWNEESESWEGLFPETKATNVFDVHGGNLQDFIDSMNFEMATNENGHYIKLPNGFLVCWGTPFEQIVDEEWEPLARSGSEIWTFPHPFINDEYFFSASVPDNSARWADASGGITPEQIHVRQFARQVSSSLYSATRTFAIGRWK